MSNQPITLNLTFNSVQTIVAKLEELPYREVAPLLADIVNQTNQQLAAQAAATEVKPDPAGEAPVEVEAE